MNIDLISYTPNAWDLLLGTKATRMRGKDPKDMTVDEKMEHWAYMLDTIKSPFEFVDYVFEIKNVSKNMTHQLVRTRTGAYQQETGRALVQTAFDAVEPDAFFESEQLNTLWQDAMADADASYNALIAAGAQLQDARAVLPSNSGTNIKAKFNLRTLSDMAKNRLCTRTGGEYQQAFRLMRELVIAVHPWTEPLLQPACIATAQCAFPRHGKENCKFWRPWMDLRAETNDLRKVFWATELTTNNPVAKNGVSNG